MEKNGTADPYLAESWDYYAEELIPFGIARFFFFDSEKISRIADDESFERIKEPVKALMGVAAAESLCARLEKIRKENGKALAKSAPAELTLEAERLGAEIGECEKRLGELQERRTRCPVISKARPGGSMRRSWSSPGRAGASL